MKKILSVVLMIALFVTVCASMVACGCNKTPATSVEDSSSFVSRSKNSAQPTSEPTSSEQTSTQTSTQDSTSEAGSNSENSTQTSTSVEAPVSSQAPQSASEGQGNIDSEFWTSNY